MTDEPKKPAAPTRIVKDTQAKPCGCVVTEYADNTAEISPCPPCGIYDAARALNAAASALAAVATRLRAENGRAAVAQAASAIANQQRKGV